MTVTRIDGYKLLSFASQIPDAYKDIDVVMEDAKELVEVEHILRQVLNVKGT